MEGLDLEPQRLMVILGQALNNWHIQTWLHANLFLETVWRLIQSKHNRNQATITCLLSVFSVVAKCSIMPPSQQPRAQHMTRLFPVHWPNDHAVVTTDCNTAQSLLQL